MTADNEQNLGHGSEVVLPTIPSPTARGSISLLNRMVSKLAMILFPPHPNAMDPKKDVKIIFSLYGLELIGMLGGAFASTVITRAVPELPATSTFLLMDVMGAGIGASLGYRLGCRIT